MASMWILRVVSLMIAIYSPMLTTAALEIGVCYGMLGDNLPPAADVIAIYELYGIGRMRLYDPNPSALEALRGKNIELALGVRNEDIQNIASSQDAAESWFATNMEPYVNDIPIIFLVVGNEVIPGKLASYVAPAMQNLLTGLQSHNLGGIRVTTSVAMTVLQNTYPPSASEFQPEVLGPLVDVLKVLSGQGASVLMVNMYPYFAYAGDPANISQEYVLFKATTPVVRDGSLDYYNLFDAILDGVYWAMEKAGFPDIGVAVSESGWPSAGNGDFTTPELASIYNQNFMQHILSFAGSPKRPGAYMEAFLFAMFNENLKPAGVEQNWGLFYPNKQPIYPLFPTK